MPWARNKQFLRLSMRTRANRYDRFETGLTLPFFWMISGSKIVQAASRVPFLFPIFLGRSKEAVLAGYFYARKSEESKGLVSQIYEE